MNRWQKIAIVILVIYPIIFIIHYKIEGYPSWINISKPNINPVLALIKESHISTDSKVLVLYKEPSDIQKSSSFICDLQYQLLPLIIDVKPSTRFQTDDYDYVVLQSNSNIKLDHTCMFEHSSYNKIWLLYACKH